jgi:hypothetical protein
MAADDFARMLLDFTIQNSKEASLSDVQERALEVQSGVRLLRRCLRQLPNENASSALELLLNGMGLDELEKKEPVDQRAMLESLADRLGTGLAEYL